MRQILFTTAAVLLGANLALAVTAPTFRSEPLIERGIERYDEVRTALHDWVHQSIVESRSDPTASADDGAGGDRLPAPDDGQEIAHWLVLESPAVVSVLRQENVYEAGAQGSVWLVPVNWDRQHDALIPIEAVLGEPDADAGDYERLARMLRDATVDQVWGGHPEDWAQAIEAAVQADPTYLSTFTFVPSTEPEQIGGIAWHFEPDAVAPGARGVVTVVIPQAQLRELIEPEWHARMAGEPDATVTARSVAPEDTLLQNALSAAHM